MSDFDARAKELDTVIPDRGTERWFRAIAEEAGEVVGAYNKMDYIHTPEKLRTKEDVLEEMGQLIGCVIVSAQRLGFSWGELCVSTEEFMASKAAEITARRAEHE